MTIESLRDVLSAKFSAVPWGKEASQDRRALFQVPADKLLGAAGAVRDAFSECRLLFATAAYADGKLYWIVDLLGAEGFQVSLRTNADSNDLLPSISSIWSYADWQEKEAHELFGLRFQGCSETEPFLLRSSRKQFPHRRQ